MWYATGGILFESLVSVPVAAASLLLDMLLGDVCSVITAVLAWIVLVSFVDHHRLSVRFIVGSLHWFAHVFSSAIVAIMIDWILRTLAVSLKCSDGKDHLELHAQWQAFSRSFDGIASFIDGTLSDWTFGFVHQTLGAARNASRRVTKRCASDKMTPDPSLVGTAAEKSRTAVGAYGFIMTTFLLDGKRP